MWFWVFMLLMALLTPAVMIVVGLLFLRAAPKRINMVYGYRTAMSMKNRDTWEFAHRYSGRLWLFCGLALLPVSVAVMLLVLAFHGGEGAVSAVGSVTVLVQLAVLVGTIFSTERALKQTFDQEGKRKAPDVGERH